MPTILITLWDNHNEQVVMPYTYGKNGKRKQKPIPLKVSAWRKAVDGVKALWFAVTHWREND